MEAPQARRARKAGRRVASDAVERHGRIDSDAPLLVVALDEEAEHLHRLGLPILVTGAGKVNAAIATARVVATERPSSVINLGTAGALIAGLEGIHEVGTAIQHDLDDESLHALTGRTFGPPVELGEGPTLATGDVFVNDGKVREQLALRAQLVDMEGYGVARAALAAQLPVRLVKLVSDGADGDAATSWKESIADCAELLADWAARELG